MKNIYNNIILSLCFLFVSGISYGTHVTGGSMTYRCIGNSTYEVSLEFRRDCFNGASNAQFDEFASIGVFNSFNQQVLTVGQFGEIRIPYIGDDTLNEILTSECNVIGGDVCVQTTVYRDTLILPQIQGGYILAYQRCCYNQTLNNIQDPLNTGATLWIKITESALASCNSSPSWSKSPNVYICADDTLRFDHSAIDVDGDSLVYFMCAPSQGADMNAPMPQPPNAPPYIPVTYAAGFSENNMMGGSPISINSQTGELLAVPSQVGQFLIGVCVREFRNGVLLSEVRRDFEYNVRVCGRNPIAIITPELLTQCNDLEVAFSNNSTSNFLPVDSLDFLWLFDFPNTTLSSTDMEPVYTFPAPGLYNVAMIVTDGVCTDTTYADIGVSIDGDPTADFDIQSFDCDGTTEIQLTDLSTSSQPLEYEWILTSATGNDTSFVQNPVINIGMDQSISVALKITTPSRCNDSTFVQDIDINTIPLRAEFVDKIICSGEDAIIFSSDLPNLSVEIMPDGGVTIDGNGDYIFQGFTGAQDFIVTVSDGFCFLTDTVTIDAANDPEFPLDDIVQCGDAAVELNPFGPSFYTYNWEGPQGVALISNEPNPLVTLVDNGEFYVTVSTSPGSLCFFTDTISVDVEPLPAINVLPSEQLVYCEGTEIVISLDQAFPSMEWRFANTGFVLSNDQSVTISNLLISTMLEVVVVDDLGCSSSQFVDIQFIDAPVFNFDPISDFNVCSGDAATLIASSPDNIVWTDINNVILATGNTLVLDNVTSNTTVVATATNDLGCISEQQISVGVFQNPEIDFNPLDNISICENQVFTLSINTTDAVSWTDDDGNVLGSGSSLEFMDITTDTSFNVTVTNLLGCTTTDVFEISIDDMIIPEIDLSPLDNVSTCIGNGVVVTLDPTYDVTYTDMMGNVLSTTNVLELSDLLDMQLIEITIVDDRNCTLIDTFPITIFEDIGLVIENDQDSLVYCQGSTIIVGSSSDVSADVEWTTADGTVVGNGQLLESYMPQGDVMLTATAVDQFGCMDVDSIFLLESIIQGQIAGDAMICLGESTVLTFTPESDLEFQLDWEPEDAIIGETANSITVQPTTTTQYTMIYINEDGCEAQYFIEVVVDGFFDGVTAFADPQDILFGESTELSTDQDEDFGYLWFPPNELDDSNASMPIATPSETVTYTVTVTEDNGCTDTASVTVNVTQPNCDESDIFVPNMFTPNADMLNDTWRIESNFIDTYSLIVYDRWGEEVFSSTDQDIEWDGTFRNKELEPDVYGYYLMATCTNGFEYTKQGNVTLVK